jgi:hypothetical protein
MWSMIYVLSLLSLLNSILYCCCLVLVSFGCPSPAPTVCAQSGCVCMCVCDLRLMASECPRFSLLLFFTIRERRFRNQSVYVTRCRDNDAGCRYRRVVVRTETEFPDYTCYYYDRRGRRLIGQGERGSASISQGSTRPCVLDHPTRLVPPLTLKWRPRLGTKTPSSLYSFGWHTHDPNKQLMCME